MKLSEIQKLDITKTRALNLVKGTCILVSVDHGENYKHVWKGAVNTKSELLTITNINIKNVYRKSVGVNGHLTTTNNGNVNINCAEYDMPIAIGRNMKICVVNTGVRDKAIEILKNNLNMDMRVELKGSDTVYQAVLDAIQEALRTENK